MKLYIGSYGLGLGLETVDAIWALAGPARF